uniref:Uncharacterized protein n=1 Tax=Bicosoecida sp. CB-2014 TaxID=1486930 RepID=A0A7S1G1Q8_9STRA|mmetsp:Transcript_1017/g.3250  ORF Transcript_1017/g.3250 Transcript_1017/m.3250 type:complete len:145 (+) Transcript_1017:140-574(+)
MMRAAAAACSAMARRKAASTTATRAAAPAAVSPPLATSPPRAPRAATHAQSVRGRCAGAVSRTVVPRARARGDAGDDDARGGAEPPQQAAGKWVVWRVDTHGNKVVMRRTESEEEALRVAREFEARGHKQAYWVTREGGDSIEL